MSEVSFVGALVAGALALLSPCSALLLPSFFAYAFSSRTALLARTGVFYLGLLVTLVPLGTGAAAASAVFYGHRAALITVAGWSIIALGLLQVLGRGFTLPFVARLQSWSSAKGAGRGGYVSTFGLGAVYGLAGFCSGPVLGAILTVAATRSTPLEGGLLLAVYALGMSLPLFLLAALWDRHRLGERRWLRGRVLTLGRLRVHSTSLASGVLFVLIGALFLRYDGTAGVSGLLGLGDTTELEVSAQTAAAQATAAVPLWLLPALVAVGAGGVAWSRARRRSIDSTRS